jgi:hypothetical protein
MQRRENVKTRHTLFSGTGVRTNVKCPGKVWADEPYLSRPFWGKWDEE